MNLIEYSKNIIMNKEKYFKINNMHIFVQPSACDMNIFEEISKKKNQRIHIFEINPLAIKENLIEIINMVQDDTKVIIHIPYMVKDYALLLRKELGNIQKKWKIITEKSEVEFKCYLHIKFTKDDDYYSIQTYIGVNDFKLPRNIYDYKTNASFRSLVQLNNPEIFKDTIIKNFKKSAPHGILRSFTNDSDIWDYIMEQGEWTNDDTNE